MWIVILITAIVIFNFAALVFSASAEGVFNADYIVNIILVGILAILIF